MVSLVQEEEQESEETVMVLEERELNWKVHQAPNFCLRSSDESICHLDYEKMSVNI